MVEVRESMRNGGGPACLRLRVAVTPEEHAAVDQRFLLDEAKLAALEAWVQRPIPTRSRPKCWAIQPCTARASKPWTS